jgi:hypothetical protein
MSEEFPPSVYDWYKTAAKSGGHEALKNTGEMSRGSLAS